ncbi:MAG: hypothetical protein FGM32_10720 [Candidatus Kapabacteria bacterium]|nr:hypothetical protein [Candidatus Kapabacteria bacterium]
MKRFLLIAAAAVSLAACSQTGVVEPVEPTAANGGKKGSEAKIARRIRAGDGEKWVSSTGRTFENGRVVAQAEVPGGFRVDCKYVPLTRCWSISPDGTVLDINDGGFTGGNGGSTETAVITMTHQ